MERVNNYIFMNQCVNCKYGSNLTDVGFYCHFNKRYYEVDFNIKKSNCAAQEQINIVHNRPDIRKLCNNNDSFSSIIFEALGRLTDKDIIFSIVFGILLCITILSTIFLVGY